MSMDNPIIWSITKGQFYCKTLHIEHELIFAIPEGVQYVACREATIEGEVYILGELVII